MKSKYTKIASLIVIALFLLMPMVVAEDGDYNIGDVNKDIKILDDGTAVITENITYSITGQVNGVYRTIGLSGDQSISNVTVETPGYYNTVEIENSTNSTIIKVWLYTDEDKTQKVNDADVEVVYHYNFNKGVKMYNDIAEFQYTSWSSDWGKSVEGMVVNVEIPGSSSNIEMWNNPENLVNNYSWINDSTLQVNYGSISSSDNAEIRILMPTDYFNSTDNMDVINQDAKAQIEEDQAEYARDNQIKDIAMDLTSVLLVALIVLPVGIYYKYGREPKIDYDLKYESQIPTNHSPMFINALIPGDVGEIDINGLQATILDLVNRKYYKMISTQTDNPVMKRTNKDTSELEQYEVDVINYLHQFENKDNIINFKDLENTDPTQFNRFFDAWKIDVNRHVDPVEVGKLFNNSGANISNLVSVLSIIVAAFVIIIIFMFDVGSNIVIPVVLSIFLIIESFILFCMSNKFMGQWTQEGRLFDARWKAFKNYITDYSLIKEYPPASVQVWGEYIVYATALGCAEEVSRIMKKYFEYVDVPQEYYDYDVVFLAYFGGLHMMHTSFYALSNPHGDVDGISDYGSFGDIRGPGSGGFGGGGGGTF
ncbi:MAG: DUF2207 domain-containing protein [Methanosphaera sp.]|nr:DUF2207 domain-containing protein [Methanosphaera sp.]